MRGHRHCSAHHNPTSTTVSPEAEAAARCHPVCGIDHGVEVSWVMGYDLGPQWGEVDLERREEWRFWSETEDTAGRITRDNDATDWHAWNEGAAVTYVGRYPTADDAMRAVIDHERQTRPNGSTWSGDER